MGLFGKSRFLEPEIEDWVLDCWGWLMRNLGGMSRLRATPLVTASREFFPPTDAQGHARAEYLFERVKTLMGLCDWPCQLDPVERPLEVRVGFYAKVNHGKGALGTFRYDDGQAVITYAADLAGDPRQLIATLAHELAHYRLAAIRAGTPGGESLHELATELAVAHAGFGVFRANAAFRFEQHQDPFGQGWSTSRAGYFTEPTWAFVIALFTALKGVNLPRGHLKDSVADLTNRAQRYLSRNDGLLEPLRKIA